MICQPKNQCAADTVDTEMSDFMANLQQLNDVLVQVDLVQDAADHLYGCCFREE